ncbi:toxin-antitoxin system YwqK family antitoxin [Prolixibacter bellariivorans]|uniref:toxin-antitoxin system YwqK family antitoxin n=1 Tax=Prolixibacter bellariivorans TaxID=314319 RepID=UPI0011DCCA75|nr:hypothetical protein [Prolixibacter bellariivorans]
MRIFMMLVVLIGIMSFGFAQEPINQTDSSGLKQGHWIGRYPNGQKQYEGTFIDGEPVGEMKRYYPDGKIQARMHYVPGSDSIIARFIIRKAKEQLKEFSWERKNRVPGLTSMVTGLFLANIIWMDSIWERILSGLKAENQPNK